MVPNALKLFLQQLFRINLRVHKMYGCLLFIACHTTIFSQGIHSGSLEIYFTQNINKLYDQGQLPPHYTGGTIARERILSLIQNATSTLDVAMYNNNLTTITSALHQAKNRGVTVRYIADASTGNSALNSSLNFPILYANNATGLMHNKFVIADAVIAGQATVLTGSANFTSNSFNEDANNLIFIKNQDVAQAYTNEFNEMWGSSGPLPGSNPKFGSSKSDNTPHSFDIDGIPAKIYFSPSDRTTGIISAELEKADFDIRFAVYTFTHNELANDIVASRNSGVSIRGIMDNNEFNSKINYFKQNGVDVLDHKPSSILHHKYVVIDAAYPAYDPVVITGSHNWTYSAETVNDENTIVLYDHQIALLFEAEFNSRFCELATWDCEFLSLNQVNHPIFQLVPTLAYDFLHFESIQPGQLKAYSIFSSIGTPILFRQINKDNHLSFPFEIDISAFMPGTYFLHAQTHMGETQIFKFIKL